MVFGLGEGLGFVYVDDPRFSPVHRFNGRALDLEGRVGNLAPGDTVSIEIEGIGVLTNRVIARP